MKKSSTALFTVYAGGIVNFGHQRSKTDKIHRCMNDWEVEGGKWYLALLKFVSTDYVLPTLCISQLISGRGGGGGKGE